MLSQTISSEYNKNVQISPYQAQIIGSSILSFSPDAHVLVFGLGNDSAMWLSINKQGYTHSLESSESWIDKARQSNPNINVSRMPNFGLSVESSMELAEADFSQYTLPKDIRHQKWDVILVDGPPGHKPSDPGRAVAIAWAARLATKATHVFVDDYERPLEKKFCDTLLREGRNNTSVVIPARKGSTRTMYWSVGFPIISEA